ncbi:hypothetical protein A3K34_01025 [candidate division WWE3 bacterium RIFOXYC1_FULL_40_10]|uniref:Probable transcriptional regulatory protein A2264_01500 n=1 Tax=candidate division WWE3 bacterium RIFOXYA2_FULL_46_9 TaxID=1802636 RepID=A0A1F4W1U7_UNCKA|nr:MAG: hypothetical protein A3K58_01025 [candidate division WWE3 bacterium RIFOXYB1_FULL_40_22]OGC61452.1 MAG: hypothetical protein A3K37_01025 [candidate division WWE3 bacterium RIFOXYA1_FULL_40_11]OGC63386.1 MAG: hypothetical protein A2264_01500 [candidate division WWE3 bacterium RIFOXYA2_FULL_46_9]OGC64454.1 MAG: hypothetical protein A2326_00300 [candidate division WWE3 bacterium RIFOXYB2_FULL_41_6]OGC65835.1 MAG: hypothetical protein A3K34_01025 [candidate division WWE3 bacterium RIFOXYC1_
MSGHSKWANIKRKKGANDEKRSKIFSKLSRLIMVAAREGGGDPDSNPRLRLSVEKAKEYRMPKENIEKAILKGTGELNSGGFFETIYEGFGPNGEAFYITALTDNKNRTVAEIRSIFSRFGGSLGGAGSTSYIFTPDPDNPIFSMDLNDNALAAKLMNLLEELEDQDDIQEVYTNCNFPEEI